MKKLLLLLFPLFFSHQATGCSCFGTAIIKKEIKKSKIVITGKVASIERVYIKFEDLDEFEKIDSTFSGIFLNKVTFQVNSIYKGKRKMKTITIYTGIGGGDCGINFKKDIDYIIYGSREIPDYSKEFNTKNLKNSFWTDICTRSQELNKNEIQKIEKFKKIKR
ncbi:hypothetical protein [Aureispira sp. CCB-QB1]|uniref:hypothetical protein n=1 Tax=Aureispira sp. CCB-QB1 TaxID=1313421 RepID=UPI000696FB39|nr:hypothetical protein [Aureispira sp. CCB-QB1]